jgi:hypothetical protein
VLGIVISFPGRQTIAEMEDMLKAFRDRMQRALSRHAYFYSPQLFQLPSWYGNVLQKKARASRLSLCSVCEASFLRVGVREAEDNV